MESHINYASTQLWRIIVDGFNPRDPSNLTPREVVDEQLNVSALYIIQKALMTEDLAHIRKFKTAKGAWDYLTNLYVGNESIQTSKHEALTNESDGL